METSPEFTAESFLIQSGPVKKRLDAIDELLCRHDLGFPFVLKPDTGQRGAEFHPVKGLDNYGEMMRILAETQGSIKVYCEVAAL